MGNTAIISEDGRYRYRLERKVQDCNGIGLTVTFVMLNPSTADATQDDPTIRKCAGFARRWGFEKMVVVNLFAYRATEPRELVRARARGVDVIGPENSMHLESAMKEADRVIAAWGRNVEPWKWSVASVSRISHWVMMCLGTTKGGSPRHPLMVSYDTELERFYSKWGPNIDEAKR